MVEQVDGDTDASHRKPGDRVLKMIVGQIEARDSALRISAAGASRGRLDHEALELLDAARRRHCRQIDGEPEILLRTVCRDEPAGWRWAAKEPLDLHCLLALACGTRLR